MKLGLGPRLRRRGGTFYVAPPSIAFTNTLNTTVALQTDGSYLVTKTSADAWDGAAATAADFAGDYMMVVRTYSNVKNFFGGAALTPGGTTDQTGFNRGINGNGAGALTGIETDIAQLSTSYLADQYWFFKRVAGAHTISYGPTDDPAASTSVGALGLTNATSTVGMKLSIFHLNAQFGVRAYAL